MKLKLYQTKAKNYIPTHKNITIFGKGIRAAATVAIKAKTKIIKVINLDLSTIFFH
jgi:hypothetical protein